MRRIRSLQRPSNSFPYTHMFCASGLRAPSASAGAGASACACATLRVWCSQHCRWRLVHDSAALPSPCRRGADASTKRTGARNPSRSTWTPSAHHYEPRTVVHASQQPKKKEERLAAGGTRSGGRRRARLTCSWPMWASNNSSPARSESCSATGGCRQGLLGSWRKTSLACALRSVAGPASKKKKAVTRGEKFQGRSGEEQQGRGERASTQRHAHACH